MIWLAFFLSGLSLAEPAPPVPIPSVSVPEMPAVSMAQAPLPTWQVMRPGSHTARVHIVLQQGRRMDADPMAMHMLQRVLKEELRGADSPWRDAGMEVQWTLGSTSSQWVVDGIADTSAQVAESALETLLRPRLRGPVLRRTKSAWLREIEKAPRRLTGLHAAAVQQVERGIDGPAVRRVRAEDVNRLRRSDLVAAHRRLLDGGVRAAVVVGADSGAWVHTVLSGVAARLSVSEVTPEAAFVARGDVGAPRVLVDHPAGQLAMITVTVPVVNRDEPLAERLAAAVLGGGFDSRLNRALRQQAGLTYSADAAVVGGQVRLEATVRADEVGEAVRIIRTVLDESGPPSHAEVDAVRRGMLRAAAHELRLSTAVGATFAAAAARGEGPESVGDVIRAIAAMPVAEVEAAAARQFEVARRGWVITGNAVRIVETLEAADWLPTHSLDANTLWPPPSAE